MMFIWHISVLGFIHSTNLLLVGVVSLSLIWSRNFRLFIFKPGPGNLYMATYLETWRRLVRSKKARRLCRPEGGIEPLRLSAPTGLKPATRTTECHLDNYLTIFVHFEFLADFNLSAGSGGR